MVPILHTSVPTFRHVYIASVVDYISVVDSFFELTRSPTCHVCAEFGVSISEIFFILFENSRDIVRDKLSYFLPYELQIRCLRDTDTSF